MERARRHKKGTDSAIMMFMSPLGSTAEELVSNSFGSTEVLDLT